jgi:hypothetical protein
MLAILTLRSDYTEWLACKRLALQPARNVG